MERVQATQASRVPPSLQSDASLVTLTRLKWLAIVAPVTFLVVVTLLLRGPFHEELHHYPGYLYILAVLAAAVAAFSFFVFGHIARLERRIVEQNHELAALLAVGQAVTSPVSFEQQASEALDAMLVVTSADTAQLWLPQAGSQVVLHSHRGVGQDVVAPGTRRRLGDGLPGLVAETGVPAVANGSADDRVQACTELTELGLTVQVGLPIRHRDHTVGVLTVAARDTRALSSASERRLLDGVGKQLAITIENARLQEQVLDRAVIEERERLARELHDGLAQVLGYVNTQTLAIKRLLASGEPEQAGRQVAEMELAAKHVYTDVRQAILGLRTAQRDLVPTLRSCVDDYGRLAGASPRLEISDAAAALALPGSVEIQLVRIVQEALANVRKHAEAQETTVSVRVEEGRLRIEVADDGRGFDVAQPVRTGWPHFGLQTMRERAEAIGGEFSVESQPGVGTRIVIRLPVETGREIGHASIAR